MIYCEGDSTRMAPPPMFPKAFGLTGPMTINMNPRGPVVIAEAHTSNVASNETESTTVAISDETISAPQAEKERMVKHL